MQAPSPRPRCTRARRLLCLLLALPTLVHAQQPIGLQATAPLELDAVADDVPLRDSLSLRIGLLGALGPDFEGARAYEARAVPLLRLSWRDRIVFRGRSLDVNAILDDGLRAGPMLKSRAGRGADNADFLAGMGDVARAFEAGGFVRFRRGPLALRVNVLRDIAGAHDGLLVETSAQVGLPLGRPRFSLTFSSTWGDAAYNGTYFGVDATQARHARLPRYLAGAGFKDAGVAVGTRIPIAPRWAALVTAGYQRLLGPAARSPLVAVHGEADQFYGALGAHWTW